MFTIGNYYGALTPDNIGSVGGTKESTDKKRKVKPSHGSDGQNKDKKKEK